VEPTLLEVNLKVGVGSWITLPPDGPAVMLTWGGVDTEAKLLNAPNAGFGLRSFRSSAALEQKVHDAIVCSGSRQWYQNRRWILQALRLVRTIL
jgi:hypothetical protein